MILKKSLQNALWKVLVLVWTTYHLLVLFYRYKQPNAPREFPLPPNPRTPNPNTHGHRRGGSAQSPTGHQHSEDSGDHRHHPDTGGGTFLLPPDIPIQTT